MSSVGVRPVPLHPRTISPAAKELGVDLPFNLGVMGSAAGNNTSNDVALKKCEDLGVSIANQQCQMVTGACPGLPNATAQACYDAGGFVLGISPADSLAQHIQAYHSPVKGYSQIIYTGMGLMQRDIMNIRCSDAVALVGGRTGTLNETTIALMEGKPLGALTGTGGLADGLARVMEICGEAPRPNVIFNGDTDELVSQLRDVATRYPAAVHIDGAVTDSRPPAVHTMERSKKLAIRTLVAGVHPASELVDQAFKIGILGSKGLSSSSSSSTAQKMASSLGKAVADQHFQLIADACPGLSHVAAMACRKEGGTTIGISPADSKTQHTDEYHAPVAGYSMMQYTGMGLMQASLINIRTSDAVMIVGGDIRTLNEFTIAWKEGKPIGVLTGTGGVADGLKEILAICGEESRPNVVFSDDPKELVEKLAQVAAQYPASVHNDGFLIDANKDRG